MQGFRQALIFAAWLALCPLWGNLHYLQGPDSGGLGTADRFGMARRVLPMGELDFGGESLPLLLIFSSDPRQGMSLAGPYWRFGLLDSRLVRDGRWHLRWESPNNSVVYFSKPQSARDEERYTSMNRQWEATGDRRGQYRLRHVTSGWEYAYRDGLLREITTGSGARFRFDYDVQGRLRGIFPGTSSLPLLEAEYGRTGDLARLRWQGGWLELEHGLAKLYGPNAQPLSLRALRQWRNSQGQGEKLEYEQQEADVNRLRIKPDNGPEGWLAWQARNGLVVADDGYAYTVDSPDFEDGKGVPAGRWPRWAKVERRDASGREELWHECISSGLVRRKGPDGIERRYYRILAPGATYMKVRKIEEIREGKTVVVERNAFDDQGRVIRRIEENGDVILYERDPDGRYTYLYRNGVRYHEAYRNEKGQLIKTRLIKPEEERVFIIHPEFRATTHHYLNGELQGEYLYNEQGQVIRRIFPGRSIEEITYSSDGVASVVRTTIDKVIKP